jgi:hypothetical protein
MGRLAEAKGETATWRHGGSSTLERTVPVLHFEPC